MARLESLFDAARTVSSRGPTDVEVTGVATDSRLVAAGNLFVCLPGYRAPGGESLSDRHAYARQAFDRGARAFIAERDIDVPGSCTVVRVADSWAAAATAAARFHGHPSRSLLTVGITGTSGKTSTSYFVDAVLRAAGHRVARFGTIDYRIGGEVLPAEQTTPEAALLQALLRRAVDAGCTAAVMEVSSHALELRRVGEVEYDVGIFTNLSRDHLNFHPDMESYRAAKAMLFAALGNGGKDGLAIANCDDPEWRAVVGDHPVGAPVELVRFGFGDDADVAARSLQASLCGLRFEVRDASGVTPVRLPQLGDYNVYNSLAAFALGVRLGMEPRRVAEALANAESVPGRFELVAEGHAFAVVVDYAHKPAALEGLLAGARRLGPNRLITVFGCGGDRDRGKRPLMGRIAAEASDLVVVTSDNPRTEDPQAIVDEVLAGSRQSDPDLDRHIVEVDRAKAIRVAIESARAGDMVVIAGKGHEPYQLVGSERLSFDDRLHARQALDLL